jgi:hypothetical protein
MVAAATTELRDLIATARGVQGDLLGVLREIREVTGPEAVERAATAAVEQRMARMEHELNEAMGDYYRRILEAFDVIVEKLTGGVHAPQLVEVASLKISGRELAGMLRDAIKESEEAAAREAEGER